MQSGLVVLWRPSLRGRAAFEDPVFELLFTHHFLWVLVASQAEKDRLPQLIVAGPLGKLALEPVPILRLT
jgi:hypothetical protein